jgi:hypothetical protein
VLMRGTARGDRMGKGACVACAVRGGKAAIDEIGAAGRNSIYGPGF